jgi:hypothetical protein
MGTTKKEVDAMLHGIKAVEGLVRNADVGLSIVVIKFKGLKE